MLAFSAFPMANSLNLGNSLRNSVFRQFLDIIKPKQPLPCQLLSKAGPLGARIGPITTFPNVTIPWKL